MQILHRSLRRFRVVRGVCLPQPLQPRHMQGSYASERVHYFPEKIFVFFHLFHAWDESNYYPSIYSCLAQIIHVIRITSVVICTCLTLSWFVRLLYSFAISSSLMISIRYKSFVRFTRNWFVRYEWFIHFPHPRFVRYMATSNNFCTTKSYGTTLSRSFPNLDSGGTTPPEFSLTLESYGTTLYHISSIHSKFVHRR